MHRKDKSQQVLDAGGSDVLFFLLEPPSRIE
jgi:hypothetical protein